MRRRLVLLLLVVLALPATLALAADTDPKKQINPADQRKAASIALKRSDFPAGWKKASGRPKTNADAGCPGYNPDQSDLVLTGEAMAEFEGAEGIPSVSSATNVYKSRREAQAAWSRSAKPALAPCLARLLERELAKTGVKASVTKSGKLAFPKLAPRTIAYTVVLTVTVTQAGQQTKVPFTIHIVGLGNGRGDALLMTVGFGGGIPMADLRAFAKLTASRLAAAKL